MLLEFTFQNFACFHMENTFSMVGTREKQHTEHVAKLFGCRAAKVLPIAALFGANASGKSTFIEALSFAKRFVTTPSGLDDLIPVAPFAADLAQHMTDESLPVTHFSFLILVGDELFRYAFSVNETRVLFEKLAKAHGEREELLFLRDMADISQPIRFGTGLADTARLDAVFQGTRGNQLFLNNTAFQNLDTFRGVFEWFRDQLEIIDPGAYFVPVERFFDHDSPLGGRLQEALDALDTGIVDLKLVDIPVESVAMAPEERDRIAARLKEGMTYRLRNGKDIVILSRESGVVNARRMIAIHRDKNDGVFPLPMVAESDGTIRLIDLLPAFFTLGNPSARKVYIVDELDRSLHPTLMRYLVELFLKTASASTRSQIVFTTHNIDLMTQEVFRRDEMWIVRKSRVGESELLCLGDFKDIRYDKDIRKSYMEGRFGGIPHISPRMNLDPPSEGAPTQSENC